MGSTALPVRVPVRAIDVVPAAKRGGEKSQGFKTWGVFRSALPGQAVQAAGQKPNLVLALIGCPRRSYTGRAVVAGHLGSPRYGGTLPSRPVSFAWEVGYARCWERRSS